MIRLYFAYGSNMSVAQMKQRCPAARPLGTASLEDWRFIINQRGTASIVPHAGGRVHGVIWRCTRDCIATLDVYEGVAKRRYRKLHVTTDTLNGPIVALTYAGLYRGEGRPIRAYHEGTVIPAARDWVLDPDYLAELESWLGSGVFGPIRKKPRGRSWRP
ncbi:MAG: gamma-glutamylcyclotransferase family protein [Pseudomonadota bacterium]